MANITIQFSTNDEPEFFTALIESYGKALRGPQLDVTPEVPAAPLGSPQVFAAHSTAAVPPLPPVPAAPAVSSPAPTSAAPAPAPVAPGGVELDSEGYPWDERIHSGAKSKTQAGIWTRRRNVPDEVYFQIRDQIKAGIPAPAPAAAAIVPPPPVAAPPAPPQPDPGAPVPPGLNPFVGLMRRVAADVGASRYGHDQLKAWISSLGDPSVTTLPQLNGRPELITQLNALLDAV